MSDFGETPGLCRTIRSFMRRSAGLQRGDELERSQRMMATLWRLQTSRSGRETRHDGTAQILRLVRP